MQDVAAQQALQHVCWVRLTSAINVTDLSNVTEMILNSTEPLFASRSARMKEAGSNCATSSGLFEPSCSAVQDGNCVGLSVSYLDCFLIKHLDFSPVSKFSKKCKHH